ncbi:hypothetical protein [Halorubrum sp. BOL3-1]|uniref:hypothetical protein n=1 Tax=Halorubrum sp. BOL3-1 TaxID=2497325 RepID=UPI001F503348|nr:hypothetical protein [Halorubrum sp. BOL3-1]
MSPKALLGSGRAGRRTLGAAAVAVATASVPVVLPWEPIRTAGGHSIWAVLVAVGPALAARAGRR